MGSFDNLENSGEGFDLGDEGDNFEEIVGFASSAAFDDEGDLSELFAGIRPLDEGVEYEEHPEPENTSEEPEPTVETEETTPEMEIASEFEQDEEDDDFDAMLREAAFDMDDNETDNNEIAVTESNSLSITDDGASFDTGMFEESANTANIEDSMFEESPTYDNVDSLYEDNPSYVTNDAQEENVEPQWGNENEQFVSTVDFDESVEQFSGTSDFDYSSGDTSEYEENPTLEEHETEYGNESVEHSPNATESAESDYRSPDEETFDGDPVGAAGGHSAITQDSIAIILHISDAYRNLTESERKVSSQLFNDGKALTEEAEYVYHAMNVDSSIPNVMTTLVSAKQLDDIELAFFLVDLDEELLFSVGSLVEFFTGVEMDETLPKTRYARKLVGAIKEMNDEAMNYVTATESVLNVIIELRDKLR